MEFDDDYHITLYYGTVKVTLGPDTLLEEKITKAAAILPKLSGKSGVLHLEDYTKDTVNIIFTEDVPEEEQTDGEADTSKEGEQGQDSGEDSSGDEGTDTGSDENTSQNMETGDGGGDTVY